MFKIFFFFFFFLYTSVATAQSREYLISLDSAKQYFKEGNYRQSKSFWLKCVMSDDYKRRDFYYLAGAYSMLGDLDSAFFFLEKSIELGLEIQKDTSYLDKVPYFELLRTDSRWHLLNAQYMKNCSGNPTGIDVNLVKELSIRKKLDQKFRQDIVLIRNNLQAQNHIDSLNQVWLDSVVTKRGWLTKNIVGKDGTYNAWLIIQHADKNVSFQQKILGLMKEKIKLMDRSELKSYAYLYDRVQINLCQRQFYGTQYSTIEDEKGEVISIEFKPIDDSAFVDRRRKYMNLPPLEYYRQFALKHYKKKG